jgi:hypothetical protein
MTAAERAKCREIAEALDAGDVAVARRERAFLDNSERAGLMWDLRKQQREKRKGKDADDGGDDVVCPTCGGSGRLRRVDDDDAEDTEEKKSYGFFAEEDE